MNLKASREEKPDFLPNNMGGKIGTEIRLASEVWPRRRKKKAEADWKLQKNGFKNSFNFSRFGVVGVVSERLPFRSKKDSF